MPTYTLRRGVRRWKGQVKINGHIVATKLFGSTKKDRRAAIVWEEQTRAEILINIDKETTRTNSLEADGWAVKYLDYAKSRFSDKTYREKRYTFARFFKRFAQDTPLADITCGQALEHLQGEFESRSGYAANKDRKNLATAWKWGQKYLPDFPERANPFLAVDRFPEVRNLRYVPPEKDFWAVLAIAEGQDRVMLMAFLHLAPRRGELFRLKWEDVDFGKNVVRLSTKKTKDGSWRYDWIPLSEELRGELSWWYGNRPYPSAEYVFIMLDDTPSPRHNPGGPFQYRQKFMSQICKRAGVKHFGYHAIRHLSATILYKAGKPISVIQKILRHKNPTTTEIYLRSLGFEPGEMREAVEAFSNRGPA